MWGAIRKGTYMIRVTDNHSSQRNPHLGVVRPVAPHHTVLFNPYQTRVLYTGLELDRSGTPVCDLPLTCLPPRYRIAFDSLTADLQAGHLNDGVIDSKCLEMGLTSLHDFPGRSEKTKKKKKTRRLT